MKLTLFHGNGHIHNRAKWRSTRLGGVSITRAAVIDVVRIIYTRSARRANGRPRCKLKTRRGAEADRGSFARSSMPLRTFTAVVAKPIASPEAG